jgi:hypothetical protein
MKSPYLLKLTFLLLTGMSFNSLSLSAQETKNVAVGNFSGVSASTGIDVYLRQGTATSAKIVADDDVINEVVLENNNNNLSVKFREHNNLTGMWKNRKAKVYITYKSLNAIAASSGSSIVTENTLKTDKLDARVSSGADISLDLACSDLQLQTSSGASAVLKGKATNMDLKSSSGASIKALELTSDYARVASSSGAGIRINVNKGLETTSSSGGSIHYKGNAALNNRSSSKSSNVRRLD